MRHCFSKVFIIVCSAILMLNVLGYIGESLYLHTPTFLYKQFLDYLKITQMVNSITKPEFENLDFLIPKTRLISKTMIFVDKIDEPIALVTYF